MWPIYYLDPRATSLAAAWEIVMWQTQFILGLTSQFFQKLRGLGEFGYFVR